MSAHELIIIGAGPAGLTAGLYAGRYRLKTLLLEMSLPGGRILMTESIENFPGFLAISPRELVAKFEEQARNVGVEIEINQVLELDCRAKVVKCEKKTYKAEAIIIATGSKSRKLGVDGEDRLLGRGVSYCATCDAPFFKNKRVAVVGGGNSAIEEALYLTRFARQVDIVHRRNELRASRILQEKLNANKKINLILESVVTQIQGDSRVQAIKIADPSKRKEKIVECEGIFIYVGNDPNTGFIKGLKMDEQGFIVTNHELGTSEEGIFACGDCRQKSLYQVITACSEGAVAADSVQKYLLNR